MIDRAAAIAPDAQTEARSVAARIDFNLIVLLVLLSCHKLSNLCTEHSYSQSSRVTINFTQCFSAMASWIVNVKSNRRAPTPGEIICYVGFYF